LYMKGVERKFPTPSCASYFLVPNRCHSRILHPLLRISEVSSALFADRDSLRRLLSCRQGANTLFRRIRGIFFRSFAFARCCSQHHLANACVAFLGPPPCQSDKKEAPFPSNDCAPNTATFHLRITFAWCPTGFYFSCIHSSSY